MGKGKWAGRKGGSWRKARAYVLLRDGYRCHICGCGPPDGSPAGDADHHPLSRLQLIDMGLDPDDPKYLKAAHGAFSPCRIHGNCNGRKGGPRKGGPKRTEPNAPDTHRQPATASEYAAEWAALRAQIDDLRNRGELTAAKYYQLMGCSRRWADWP